MVSSAPVSATITASSRAGSVELALALTTWWAAGDEVEALFTNALPRLVEGGFLTLDSDRLAATAAGRQRLDAVLAALLD